MAMVKRRRNTLLNSWFRKTEVQIWGGTVVKNVKSIDLSLDRCLNLTKLHVGSAESHWMSGQ